MTVILSNVDKIFKISHERQDTLFSQLGSIFEGNKYENFYALRNINLEIKQGECIGIIGENGSGKSTLLKIISKILIPTKGKIVTEGKVVPLIELGVGLQDDLTAKENVFLYGTIMGLKRNEIKVKLNNITEFSGLHKFMGTRFRSFSSGMRVRLAFSIAMQTNPDILLLDEIFAVGDKEFQEKSLKVLNEFKRSGKTILLASHDLIKVKEFCKKTILLHKGRVIRSGDTNRVLNYYNRVRT